MSSFKHGKGVTIKRNNLVQLLYENLNTDCIFGTIFNFFISVNMHLAMSESNTPSKPILLGKNYFLIGFMGTGKSHWGKLWAAAYKLTFIDLDELIEQDEQTTIAEIFEVKGEA